MDFVTKVSHWDSPLGSFALVKLADKAFVEGRSADGAALMAHSQSARPAVYFQLVADISGSMKPNMEHLVNTALGAVDIMPDGSALRIIIFDHDVNEIVPKTLVTADGRAALKDTIRTKFVNRDGMTNLAIPLTMAFTAETGAATMFLTDGLANRGEVTNSDALVRLARKLPGYSKNVAHTLGLQINRGEGINADLLKDLALDTSGVFRMGHNMEDVSSFVGDVLADHYLRRYEGLRVRLMSDDLKAPKTITPEPLTGFVLRADRELNVVYAWPAPGATLAAAGAAPPPAKPENVHIAIDGLKVFSEPGAAAAAAAAGPGAIRGTVPVQAASDADIALILGAHAASVLEKRDTTATTALKTALDALLAAGGAEPVAATSDPAGGASGSGAGGAATGAVGLGPLSLGKIALLTTQIEVLVAPNDARGAETLYSLAAGYDAHDDTPAVACMRVLSSTASASQPPPRY